MNSGADEKIIEIKKVGVSLCQDGGKTEILRDVSFSIGKGELFAVVGESGSGKSVTALTIMGLLPRSFKTDSGKALFRGENLLTVGEKRMRELRGDRISMIFQDPLTALNPLLKIGFQITESLIVHNHNSKKDAMDKAVFLLEKAGIQDVRRCLDSYPHQLSGGMRQRVMIASALACDPDLLIADEPTTALDVTVQASIMRLIKGLCAENGTALMLISHNLSLVRNTCSRAAVVYSGSVMETCSCSELFENPLHPYTKMLISCLPKIGSSERLVSIAGSPPIPSKRPEGCPFNPRCPKALDICRKEEPPSLDMGGGHIVKCFLHAEKRGV